MSKPSWIQKQFDRYADQAARPVRGRHLIVLAAIGVLALEVDPWWSKIVILVVLLALETALRNRHENLEYFRKRGIDPYNKKQVKEDEARLHRELQEKRIIPPD
jgi:hypothetical protein